MKNKIKFIGIIAFVAVIGLFFIGCKDKDGEGTFVLKNDTNVQINAAAISGSSTDYKENDYKKIESGGEGKWEGFPTGDGVYTWTSNSGPNQSGNGTFKIEKDKTTRKSTSEK